MALLRENDGFVVEPFGETLHGKVVVGQQKLALSAAVHRALFIVVTLVQCQQEVVNGRIEVVQLPMQGASAGRRRGGQ